MLGKIDQWSSLTTEERRVLRNLSVGVKLDYDNIRIFSRMKNTFQDITHYSMHYTRNSERRDSTFILFKNPQVEGMYIHAASVHSPTANNIGRIKFFFEVEKQFYVSIMVLHWHNQPPFLIKPIGLFAVSDTSSSEINLFPVDSIVQITSLFPMDYEGNKIWISVPHLSYY
jgi:hypothetical protein